MDTKGERVSGKIAIVTGAGYDGRFLGTGSATVQLLAAQGASVGLLDVDGERAQLTASRIGEAGGECVVVVADVTDTDACRGAIEQIADRYGGVDILINNAGIVGSGSVVDIDETVWDRVLAVNLTSVMRVSRFAIPHMRRRGGGSIVNVSSIAGIRGMGTASYAASKGGVIALTADMAYTHGREGIRVNCIAPGHLFTPMGYQGDEELRDARRAAGLLGTEGDAWDVAWAVLFLASDESRWITGAVLPVDAGTTATTALAMRHHLAAVATRHR